MLRIGYRSASYVEAYVLVVLIDHDCGLRQILGNDKSYVVKAGRHTEAVESEEEEEER